MKTSWLRCRSLHDLSEDVLILILIRLPIKDLLLCMFVSKILCSIIRKPDFMQAYCNHNPYWLITSTRSKHIDNGNRCSYGRSFYCVDGHMEFFRMLNLSSHDISSKLGKIMSNGAITQIINGLVCCYFKNLVVLVNVFTGEVTDLPSPNIHANTKPKYYLVFDPNTHVYKLLCAKRVGISSTEFHILTIGGNDQAFSRRRVLHPQDHYPARLISPGISADGFLYWFVLDYNHEEYEVLAFDITTETFRSFVPRYGDSRYFNYLVQFKGKLSLASSFRGLLVFYILNVDGNDDHEEESSTNPSGRPPNICFGRLPSGFQNRLVPIGNSLTGDLLLTDVKPTGSSITTIYVCDHETENVGRYAIGTLPQGLEYRTDHGPNLISVMENNEQTLGALINRLGPRHFNNQREGILER